MSDIHVCTTNSLRAGIDAPAMTCFLCGKKTMFLDWCGMKCDTCKADTAWDGDLAGQVRSVRRHTGLSRKDIALESGLKQSTIKSYEWKLPSKKYYKWFKGFVARFYEQLGDDGIEAKNKAFLDNDMKIIEKLHQSF